LVVFVSLVEFCRLNQGVENCCRSFGWPGLLVVRCSRGVLNLLKVFGYLEVWFSSFVRLFVKSSVFAGWVVVAQSYSLVFVESDELFDDFGMSFGWQEVAFGRSFFFFFFCSWWFVVGSRWLRIDFPMVICCMSVRVQDNFLVRVKGESVWMACDSWWSSLWRVCVVEIVDHGVGDAVSGEFLWMSLIRRSRLSGEL